jgi:hypothetical protein
MKSDIRSASPRNLQLDFFRGLALMVIFINHMPSNPWFAYTPSRLGPSDAAETFVFLSGFAAAIAFGRSFKQAGIGLGSVRVLFRCGQIYVAHLALFILMATLFIAMTSQGFLSAQWQLDNLSYFFNQTQDALIALVSLKYVPNFIDILPMYLLIMLWLPMVWALSRIHVFLALAFSITLYIAAGYFGWELTADPLTGRPWYFNPFCWQLVFFTGFAFSSGWLPIPQFHRGLMWACIFYVVFCYPLENAFGYQRLPWFATWRDDWAPLLDKSHVGLMRYIHFLAMTYLVTNFMRSRQHWLQFGLAHKIISMGQQSLPIFMFGTCLSFAGGMLLDGLQADLFDSAWVNIAGLGLMLIMAHLLNWLDQKPWKNVNTNSNLSFTDNWSNQAMLAFSLLFITITPLLFINKQPTQISITDTTTAELTTSQSNDTLINTEEVVFQAQETNLELADTL